MLKAILAVLLALPVYKHDHERAEEKRAQMSALASAIAEESRTPVEAAFLIAFGYSESGWSLDVHNGICPKYGCDRDRDGVARARSPWQLHRNGMNEDSWAQMVGVENVEIQAHAAMRHARWALGKCDGDARCAFRLLGGLPRDRKLKGEEKRLQTYAKALEALR